MGVCDILNKGKEPVNFLGMMADMGCPVKFNEVVLREVSIE